MTAKILIVDDLKFNIDLLEEHLQNDLYEIHRAYNGQEALSKTLSVRPDLILMDEPFSALDIQTRQLMENEVLELWMAKRKAVLFITHDLDEAIAMSDRVVVLSAGPGTHPIGEFVIDLPRPRDVAEVRMQPRFIELHGAIWAVLRDEVLKGYAQQKRAWYVELFKTHLEVIVACVASRYFDFDYR